MFCAQPSGWAVAEWTVDTCPLVMGARVWVFSRPGPLFWSLNIISGGRSFPYWLSFFRHCCLCWLFCKKFLIAFSTFMTISCRLQDKYPSYILKFFTIINNSLLQITAYSFRTKLTNGHLYVLHTHQSFK
jgi:hypothetical protein